MDTHLKGIGVENFRVFKDAQYFKFAPITVLTGTNSSGKSSLINLLKLLSETYRGIPWKDKQKESFSLNNFLDTEISKDWCIRKFGNVNNLSNKFNKEKNGFSFSQLVDMPGYENSITLNILYEFDLLKQDKSNNSLRSIRILINSIKKTKIIKEYIKSIKEGQENIDELMHKEIFSIKFDKSKLSNSKLALYILYPLFIYKNLYGASIKEEISKFQEAINNHDSEDIRQQIAAFMKMHELTYQIDHVTINKKSCISINTENYIYRVGYFKNMFSNSDKLKPGFEIKELSKDEKTKRPLCLIDAWCSFDSRKIDKVDRFLKKTYGDELSNCHKIFYSEVFKLLSDVVWHSDDYEDVGFFGTDTSYIYFGSSDGPFNLKDSNGFSLKDFIKRAFQKNHKEIYNEEWWLDEGNKMFYTSKKLNRDFIKKVFIPVIKIIFEGIIIKETFVFEDFEVTSEMQNEWLKENNLQDNEDAIADLKIISKGYSNYFQTSKLEKGFYGLFIYDISQAS